MVACLSNISVKELFEEPNLKSVERKDVLILALLDSMKELGMTQLHKYLFLIFAEGRVELPIKFKKYSYGPFSIEVREEIESLEEEKLIKIEKNKIIDYSKKAVSLTSKGDKKIKEESKEIERAANKIKKILNKYSGYNAGALVDHCYNTYLLRTKGKKVDDWELERKSKISELRLLCNSLVKEYSTLNINENKKIIICTSLDYIRNILESNVLFHVDEVVSGIAIRNIDLYLDNWSQISLLIKEREKDFPLLKRLLKTNQEIFLFLNNFAKEYDIMDSVFDDTPCIA